MVLLPMPQCKTDKNYRSGFTIVELLIVVVVVGILAAITIVGYNGIQVRAQVSVAKTDLKTLGTTMQLYQVDEGTYPRNNTELLDALNRQPQALKLGVTDTGSIASSAPKSFMYCYSSDGSGMWIVASKPVSTGILPVPTGAPIYFWANGNVQEGAYEEVVEGSSGLSLCAIASSGNYSTAVWSYSPAIQL